MKEEKEKRWERGLAHYGCVTKLLFLHCAFFVTVCSAVIQGYVIVILRRDGTASVAVSQIAIEFRSLQSHVTASVAVAQAHRHLRIESLLTLQLSASLATVSVTRSSAHPLLRLSKHLNDRAGESGATAATEPDQTAAQGKKKVKLARQKRKKICGAAPGGARDPTRPGRSGPDGRPTDPPLREKSAKPREKNLNKLVCKRWPVTARQAQRHVYFWATRPDKRQAGTAGPS